MAQQGRNNGKGMIRNGVRIVGMEGTGDPLKPAPNGKEAKDSVWLGPDIMGASCDARGGGPCNQGGRGGRDEGEDSEKIMSLDLATIPQESG